MVIWPYYNIEIFCTDLHSFTQICRFLHRFAPFHTDSHRFEQFWTVLHGFAQFCPDSHSFAHIHSFTQITKFCTILPSHTDSHSFTLIQTDSYSFTQFCTDSHGFTQFCMFLHRFVFTPFFVLPEKIMGSKICFRSKIFGFPNKLFYQYLFSTYFFTQISFKPHIILDPKSFFWTTFFWTQIFFHPYILFDPKLFESRSILSMALSCFIVT